MGIRIKLIIPAVAAFFVFAGVLHLYWAPRFYEHARHDFVKRMASELAVLENELVRHLLSGDYSALYANLHYQEKRHRSDWIYLILYDDAKKQIYPLGIMNTQKIYSVKKFDIPLEHFLSFNGRTLGRIELGANWYEEYQDARYRIRELEVYLALTLTFLFLTQIYWEHRVISRPISELNRATERLSREDFSAVLPRASSDEIGHLTMNFETMRCNLLAAREKLEKRTREALEASQAKSDFLATMSHEIRTPMNGIIGMVQVLGKTGLDREQQGMVDLLTISCDNLFAVLNDVLDFSKIEAGKMELAPVSLNLEQLVTQTHAMVAGLAGGKGIFCELGVDPACPATVEVDGGRLRQVLLNLMTNGIKFTREGGVRLDVDCLGRTGEMFRIRFRVSDTGIGIAPEKQTAIFDAFTQADASTTRVHGGTGLGLAISSRLVSLMDSTLELESVPEKGSVFSFELTLPGRYDSAESGEESRASSRTVSFKGRRLLVVEDNLVNQKVVEKMLAATGMEIDLAEDGSKALERVRNTSYDLILMDYQMPVMDGITATRKIRHLEQEEVRSPVPIIALTANVLKQNEDKCLGAGMNGFLPKPVTMDALMAVLNRYLS